MKRLAALTILLISGAVCALGQTPTATPAPPSNPTPASTPTVFTNRTEGIRRGRRSDDRFEAIRGMSGISRRRNMQRAVMIYRQYIEILYREPTDRELERIKPEDADIEEYRELVRSDDAGITRLMPDIGCADSTIVISAADECLKLSMPGAGASFSFRTATYRLRRLADLSFTGDRFESAGNLLHGILAEIGDVPIRDVTPATNGMKYLNDFTPSTEFQNAVVVDRELNAGVSSGGFLYQRSVPAKANTTYVLRSVAYRSMFPRAVQGITYDEFRFDKRRDVTVAFRVIRVHDDGSVTIAWRRLADKKSPSIKPTKEDRMREDNYVAAEKPAVTSQ